MRSRPRRTRRPCASFGRAPISGTVQICWAARVSCANAAVTAKPSRHAPPDVRATAARAAPKLLKGIDIPPGPGDPHRRRCSNTRPANVFCSRIVLAKVSATLTSSRGNMVQRVATVAFEGIEARAVDVQVQVAPGLPAFNVVGLPDKAVSEARERVRAAMIAAGLALPARRITVNLAPADLPKEGSHYDLPIALGLMA